MPTLLRSPQTFLSEPIQVLASTQAHNYFLDWGEEELLQRRRFWQLNASRKELIDFGSRRSRIQYYFDATAKIYYRQVRGMRWQQVPIRSIKLDVIRFSNNICREQREYTQLLLSDRIDVQDWYTGSVRLLKYSSRAAIDIARGSSGPFSTEVEREYARIMDEEIASFNRYSKQVAAGKVPIDGRLLNAVCSLGRRLNRIFENWRLWDMRRSGFTQARRRLTVAEHCRNSEHRYGCIELARMGWQSIWDITPIGGATCWDGCLCTVEYK